MRPIKKLTISAVVIAIYVVIMYVTQGFSYGPIQMRIATSIYSLAYVYPFLLVPLGLANSLSNIIGGLGPVDIIGGFIVGILTSGLILIVKRLKLNEWLIALIIIFVPGLIVPIWLAYLYQLNYFFQALFLCAGQIVPGILGVFIAKKGNKVLPKE